MKALVNANIPKTNNWAIINDDVVLENKPVIIEADAEYQYVCGRCHSVLVESVKPKTRGLIIKCTNSECRAVNQVQ